MARGSVYKKGSGYAFRVDLGPDPATGKRRQVQRQGFRVKRDAEQALDEYLSAVRTGVAVQRSSTEVGEFLDEWLELQRSRLKETTWESYRIAVERVKQRMGKVKLQALTPLDVERFYRVLEAEGGKSSRPLSAKTVRNTHVVLRKALSDAERLGIIMRNPAAAAKPPIPVRVEHDTWSSEDVIEFFDGVADDRFYALYVLLVTTGMRRGEGLGLRWRDLDLDSGELRIVQTLTTVNWIPVFATPKTKRSRRVVYLDPDTVRVLRLHRRKQRIELLAAGPAWDTSLDLVFCDELGGLTHPELITREFRAHVRRLGLPVIRLHDLRHTYATLALKSGVHPKIVSERLGHATTAITLDLYSHVTPALGREAANVVAGRLFGDRQAEA